MNRTLTLALQVLLVSTVLSAAANADNSPVAPPGPDGIIAGIQNAGLSCPRIVNSVDQGESARGHVVRLTCAGLELTNQWDIRMITDPQGVQAPAYEPW